MNYFTDDNSYKLLSVEDDNIISNSLKNMIHSSKYTLDRVNNLNEALEKILTTQYDILLVDFTEITQEKINLLLSIKDTLEDLYIILFINSQNLTIPLKKLKDLPAQGYLEKDDKLEQLPLFIEGAVTAISQMRIIRNINNELLQEKIKLEKSYLECIEILKYTVEARDKYTKGHSDRVSQYAVLLGRKLNLSEKDLKTLEIGGIFHDIGKIGVPDSVLLKDGKLTDEEYNKIKQHTIIGKNILSTNKMFQDAIPIVYHHHERYDGNGYPDNLKAEDIPYLARIVTIVDAFDAMTSKRSYRDKMPIEKAISELKNNSGTQFDSQILNVFLKMLENHELDEIFYDN